MRSDGHNAPRSHGLDSIAPGALKAAAGPQSGSGRPAANKGVRLSVEEEDQLPQRERGGGGSRWPLYLGAALVVGGGGFLVARQLSAPPPPATPELTAARVENPAAMATPEPNPAASADAAAPEANTGAAALSAEAKPEPTPAAPAPTPAAAPTPNEKPAAKTPEPSASKSSDKSSASSEKSSSSEGSGSAREPKDYSGWVSRGDQLLSKRDYAGAQQAFQTAVSLRGTGSEANSGLGAALVAQGQTREAVAYLTRAANNGFAEASVTLGDAYRKLGDKDGAIEAYETYLARLPKGARANYVKLQLEGLGKDTGGARAEPAPAREPESRPAPSTDYRPAGEMMEPAPTAPATEPPQ